jgi:hypothetical protein
VSGLIPMTDTELTDYLFHLRTHLEAIEDATQRDAPQEALSEIKTLTQELDEKIGEMLGVLE